MKIPDLKELFKAGAYIGHSKKKRHPKMKPYIFGLRGNVFLIDLEKTRELLEKAVNYMKDLGKNKALILFVCTKPIVKNIVKEYAQKIGAPYIIERWSGGILTNFEEIKKGIDKYKKFKQEKENQVWQKYVKKERVRLEKQFYKLEKRFKGIEKLDKKPDAILIVDPRKEDSAVKESIKTKTPTIAIIDVDGNPEQINYPIPANDEGVKSVELILKTLIEAYQEGQKQISSTPQSNKDNKEKEISKENQKIIALQQEGENKINKEKEKKNQIISKD